MELQSSGGFHHVAACNPLRGEDIWTAEAEFRMSMMVIVAIIIITMMIKYLALVGWVWAEGRI